MSNKETASLIIHNFPKNIIIRMKQMQQEAYEKGDPVPKYLDIVAPILEKALLEKQPENTEK